MENDSHGAGRETTENATQNTYDSHLMLLSFSTLKFLKGEKESSGFEALLCRQPRGDTRHMCDEQHVDPGEI